MIKYLRTRDALVGYVLIAVMLAAYLPLLTKLPPPGGDEPGFVDPAATFARHGFVGTPLYHGWLPGMEKHVYWQPPVYFITLGLWFKAFGIGLVQARAFSVLCGVSIVLCVYALARVWVSPITALAVAGLCGISDWMIGSSHIARMDNYCILFIMLSALVYQRAVLPSGRSFPAGGPSQRAVLPSGRSFRMLWQG